MAFVSIGAAQGMGGLRIVGLRGIPSPWTEAAKGVFHVKRLPYVLACQHESDRPRAVIEWAGDVGVPVVAYERERPRSGWAEILFLAERLAPSPTLIPADAEARALMFGLAHEICGQMGLGWCMRLLTIRDSLGHGSDAAGMSPRIAAYLAPRYGFEPDAVAKAEQRVVDVLTLLAGRIVDRDFLVGDSLSALDVYSATFANLIQPLPEEELPMRADMREAYTCRNERVLQALSPALRAHQRKIYTQYLQLPIEL